MKDQRDDDEPERYFDDDIFEVIENMHPAEREFYERFQEKFRTLKPEMPLRDVLKAYYGLMIYIARILDRKGSYTPADSGRGRFFMTRVHRPSLNCVISQVSVVYQYPQCEYRSPPRIRLGEGTTIVNCIHEIEKNYH